MNKSECILKDRVLKYLNEVKRSESDSKIASEIGYEPFEVGFAGEQLAELGLVELRDITGPDSGIRNEYIITLRTKGLYFFRHHSFISEYNTFERNGTWTRTKTIAATANAVIIILIAAMSLIVSYRNNIEHKRTNKQLQDRVDELELQNQTVTDSINVSTCNCIIFRRSDLIRNYQVSITITDGNDLLPNAELSMKAGEFWTPPTKPDLTGKIEFGLDNKNEIDTLHFEHPEYLPLSAQLDFKDGNYLECIAQLKQTRDNKH